MPPLPGEERLLTVFADVHYYFSPPSPRPLHHRFDKASYLYLYHDATQHKTRIEIANNPGTAEQDAFHGSLGNVYLQNAPKFPTCLTIVVDPHGAITAEAAEQSDEWRLPSSDPRDGGNFLFRLHTVDIYFWTADDASQFLNTTNRLLSPTQLEGTGSLPPLSQPLRTEESTISPVVKQLETVAITDPAYSHGQTRNSRSEESSKPPPPPGPPPPAAPVANPATSISPHTSQAPNSGAAVTSGIDQSPATYAPLAYNPSAPPAPEPIKHREKTPPPPDAADGTGLAAAHVADQTQAYAPPPAQAPGTFAPPPMNQPQPQGPSPPISNHSGYGAPPMAGMTHGQRTSISSHSSTPQHSNVPSFAPPPPAAPTPPVASTPGSHPPAAPMTFAPPPQDPNAHLYAQQGSQAPGISGVQPAGYPTYSAPYNPAVVPHQQQQQPHQTQHYQPQYADYMQTQAQQPQQHQVQQQPPLGGYAHYSYDNHQQSHHPVGDPNVHSQVYRPTEAEVHPQGYKPPHRAGTGLSDKGARVEKGVNRFLKKLDKF
ncbi:hypothetical protein FQN54_003785 [Arachnomyces sp. PD_36]|nr:hypothetical protein FQN54_003785 [Arachnomyces sp. PD_36]